MSRRGAEVPQHYEHLPLKGGPRVALWCAAGLFVLATLGIGTLSERSAAQTAAGAVVGVLAAIAVVAAYRLGTFEVTVTRASLKAGYGPFGVAVPLWGVRVRTTQAASSWRRLYAPRELTVELEDPRGTRTLTLPSSAPDDLAAVLRTLQAHQDRSLP